MAHWLVVNIEVKSVIFLISSWLNSEIVAFVWILNDSRYAQFKIWPHSATLWLLMPDLQSPVLTTAWILLCDNNNLFNLTRCYCRPRLCWHRGRPRWECPWIGTVTANNGNGISQAELQGGSVISAEGGAVSAWEKAFIQEDKRSYVWFGAVWDGSLRSRLDPRAFLLAPIRLLPAWRRWCTFR